MTTSSSASSANSTKEHTARRARPRWRDGLICLALAAGSWAAGAGLAEAYIRIQLDGHLLYLENPVVTIRPNFQSFENEGLDAEAVRSAILIAMERWNEVPASAVEFRLGSPTTSTNESANGSILYMDSGGQGGYFGPGDPTVAVTTISYNPGSGSILDIDIIFNGGNFNFATELEAGRFDIQDVLTHELGHMIGLDHSPVHGASMYPYVEPMQYLHRSLTYDDQAGAVAVARSGSTQTLRGKVVRGNSNAVRGAGVAAVRADDGRLAGAVVSGTNGNWTMKGIPSGNYHVYCFPLDSRMTPGTLTSDNRGSYETDFGVAFYGGHLNPSSFTVTKGASTNAGTLVVAPDAAVRDNFDDPKYIERGTTGVVQVYGSNFNNGSGSMFSLSPYLTLTPQNRSNGAFIYTVEVDPSAPAGSYDVYLDLSNGELEAVPGAIEVENPAPVIDAISETFGDVAGGQRVFLDGSGFVEGSIVLVGGRVAEDIRFLSETRLRFDTPEGDGGDVNVVVQNPDGQEVVSEDLYRYTAIPLYESIFPRAGQQSGGTLLRVSGSGFAPGMSVQVDGKDASMDVLSDTVIEITTPPGDALGAVDIAMTSADGVIERAEDVFTYVSVPDPVIEDFSPTRGGNGGGTRVDLFGDNIQSGVRVRFGADPISVQGGRFAGGVTRVDESELRSTTPSGAAGQYAVLVEMPNGQGAIGNALFTYTPSSGGGGGGCGGVANGQTPGKPADWLPFLVLISMWRLAGRRRPESAR